ncbi:MAG: redoxin domain-containing protein [Planctomycetota bacterium]
MQRFATLSLHQRLVIPFLAITCLTHSTSIAQFSDPVGANEQYVPRHLLGLIHAPEVHQELKLSEGQIAKLEAFFAQVDGDWFRARNLPAEKNSAAIKQLEASAMKWFQANTSQTQQNRLKQIEMRAQGIRMLLRADLGRQLQMEPNQTSQLIELAKKTNEATQALQQATMKNAVTEELKTAVLDANTAERDSLSKIMQQTQMQKLQEILGAPFETSKLKRIFPMAPELIPVQNWINSNPLTLKQMRGKVVLLHFYAFQCHNCHANFDVYQRWHDKYGDDVVVLGIQTPETSAERDPASVKKAATEAKLKFPILVDLKSENWKKWSNTMWPTVYVIDKNGYIRQWWQGELRWQGATGDQTIEKLISELLAENS